MGSRGSRRRTRTTVLAVANGLLVIICVAVSAALFSQNQWILRAAAVAAALVALGVSILTRHQLLVERLAHGADRVQVAQEYSRLTNARVVENAEFVDLMHRRLDRIDERLDKIDEEVATVVAAGDKHSIADAPTVVDLKLRGLAAS
jgi:LPS O-antigen subunit length determinant protein (WzzB/FepE family)